MMKPLERTKTRLPLDLQMFAGEGEQGQQGAQGQQSENNQSGQQASFDYDKLASIISGKQQVTEDTVLKNYFKQQGLTQEEANSAIETFKKQKAESTPDVNAIQSELQKAKQQSEHYQIQNVATLEAIGMGLDNKTIPYVLRLADMSNVIVDGEINKENITKAINQVLDDVPQLKPASMNTDSNGNGFQIGAKGQEGGQTQSDAIMAAFGFSK